MNFDLTDEQILFRNMAREFAEREITPLASEDDQKEYYRPEITKNMAKLGLLGAPLPQEFGGLGTDSICYALICEEIARASASVFTTTLTVHISLFQMPILKWASDVLKQKYLPRTTKGELLGCFGMTEPNVGSDSASIETTATQSGDCWVLNGNKMWISNGGIADIALVLAQTDKSKKHRGIAAFLVERNMPGFSSKDIHGKLGLKSSNTAELMFQDCRVPAENIVGQVGDGFKVGMYALDNGRMSTGAACVGIAQASIDASTKYAQERIQFGRAIANFQLVQEMIVETIVETEAARFLVHRAAHLKDKGEPFTREACMAKYYAAEVAVRSAVKAVKVHGGYGYSNEYPVERYYRDAMGLCLYEGTGEIQKLIIGRESLGTPAFV
ncbi:MAG: acyl-CoA dehydrogenase [Chloroflexi bacterium]|nr:acyl-CoA dehydrogenase [Chloroflexota bacterium]MBM3183369.1 acyl-CoA dehydrogenase [Chloroflexota bacterium]MBM4452092.1 acyl-CoA dehydrogenase [Chloroflexota bacterium]